MATLSRPLHHPAPGSRGASVAGGASGMEQTNLAVGLGNPAGFIVSNEKLQLLSYSTRVVPTDRHTRVMTYAATAGETFDCHEQSSAFWLTDAHNSFYAKQVNETEKHTLAAGFEATADIDESAECEKQPVASLDLSSDSGISAYSMHGTKSISPLLRVSQVSLFLLAIFLSASQVSSSAEAKKDSEEIGSCRFDLTSVATLSCVEPGGSWRPPSVSCCNALLYAIDHLPASNESGACCLCRYMNNKYYHFALATSYVLCKGKDKSIITTWSSVPRHCYEVCYERNASSHGLDTTAAELSIQTKDFRIAALVVAALCAIFLACFCFHRRYKPILTGGSQPLNLQRQGSPSEARDERKPPRRHSSAQRRMSFRGSPNG